MLLSEEAGDERKAPIGRSNVSQGGSPLKLLQVRH